jgi:hypothetical protein
MEVVRITYYAMESMRSHKLIFIVTARRAVPATFHRLTIAQPFPTQGV